MRIGDSIHCHPDLGAVSMVNCSLHNERVTCCGGCALKQLAPETTHAEEMEVSREGFGRSGWSHVCVQQAGAR